MGETLERWYTEGLRSNERPAAFSEATSTGACLYTAAWSSVRDARLPRGITVSGGGLYVPNQGFPADRDVRAALQLDAPQMAVDVNLLFQPKFEIEVFEESAEFLIYRDLDGIKRKFLKDLGIIPTALQWIVTDWESWQSLKEQRLNPTHVRERLPRNWRALVERYGNRDYPLVLGGYPCGYFGTPAHLMGYERLFFSYVDQPELVHDIQATFTELWLNVFSEVLSEVEVDLFVFWEDVSSRSGSMISRAMIREFMTPYYRRMIDFLSSHGVKTVFVDTDGDCTELIPVFLEAGATGIYPMETGTGMDLVGIRRSFPDLQLMGGVPKEKIASAVGAIDGLLQPVKAVLETGRYIPFADHSITPDVSWDAFSVYRRSLNALCDSGGKG
jgi:hypothetical protein